jgi:hypothetical protein
VYFACVYYSKVRCVVVFLRLTGILLVPIVLGVVFGYCTVPSFWTCPY